MTEQPSNLAAPLVTYDRSHPPVQLRASKWKKKISRSVWVEFGRLVIFLLVGILIGGALDNSVGYLPLKKRFDEYKATHPDDQNIQLWSGSVSSNGTFILKPDPEVGSDARNFHIPPQHYLSGFRDGVEWESGTVRFIHNNEKKLGRALTDEEIEAILQERLKDAKVVAPQPTPI